ncbi:hypothetical protein [Kitasatospora cineracea]|uniref:Uncharacterized protein n=1 Tax=Kitasatospora cineracea TaxID=88074 RepID=A0A3N4QZ73_9ACTN|nr:hypothetical protein [Kitasatospora cineracea]RPE26603.1 hypothetical protein EDD38_7664 [Kitasatospora cineracea]
MTTTEFGLTALIRPGFSFLGLPVLTLSPMAAQATGIEVDGGRNLRASMAVGMPTMVPAPHLGAEWWMTYTPPSDWEFALIPVPGGWHLATTGDGDDLSVLVAATH